MIGKFKTLLVATLVIGSVTGASAQPGYYMTQPGYYYLDTYDIPAEQHRFYDRNSVDFNS
jgi:hypothetical protein